MSMRTKEKFTASKLIADTPIMNDKYLLNIVTVLPSCELLWFSMNIPLCQLLNQSSRLQEALNKYQQKRRLLHERMQVFSQYLRYGGVDVGAKIFGGVSEAELKAMEKDAMIAARSQSDISVDKMLLDIDFEAVTKGFL